MVYWDINKLRNVLDSKNVNNIFLVTGKKSFNSSGAKKLVTPLISKYNTIYFSDFITNPRIEDVNKGIKIFKNSNIDIVIAIGGGSVIDIAKLINFFSAQDYSPLNYIKEKPAGINKTKPLIAIPTTAGTGSEATHFAVLYINKNKYSVAHDYILPEVAIIDAKFTLNLPPYIIACTGMDALVQAIESCWSVYSTKISKQYAKEAITLIVDNLVKAVKHPTLSIMRAMMRAAHLSGKAINISKTTVCHAISYPITSFFKIPHGHAVALTLSSMLEYNSKVTGKDVLDKRGVKYVKNVINDIQKFLGVNSIACAKNYLDMLMDKIGLKRNLKELGIKSEKNLEIIIKNGFNPDRVKNNPRNLTKVALRNMLKNIF